MRKLFAIAVALGLLPGLFACGAPSEEESTVLASGAATEAATQPVALFDLETYKETLEENAYRADKIGEVFRPLQDHEGILPDEAVLAFAHYLACACEGLYNFEAEEYPFLTAHGRGEFSAPDYPALAEALEGKLSPGAARWLELKAEAEDYEADIYEPDDEDDNPRQLIPFEHSLRLAKAWYEFETGYPEIAASEYSAYYGNSSGSWADSYLDSGEYYGLSEESKALYTAKQKTSMEEFLSDEANKKYPFYDAVYQSISQ